MNALLLVSLRACPVCVVNGYDPLLPFSRGSGSRVGPSQAASCQEGGKTDVSHPLRGSPPVAKGGKSGPTSVRRHVAPCFSRSWNPAPSSTAPRCLTSLTLPSFATASPANWTRPPLGAPGWLPGHSSGQPAALRMGGDGRGAGHHGPRHVPADGRRYRPRLAPVRADGTNQSITRLEAGRIARTGSVPDASRQSSLQGLNREMPIWGWTVLKS